MATYPVKPATINVGGKWLPLSKIAHEDMVRFVQEYSLDALMRGVPFGDVIGQAVWYGTFWHQENPEQGRAEVQVVPKKRRK